MVFKENEKNIYPRETETKEETGAGKEKESKENKRKLPSRVKKILRKALLAFMLSSGAFVTDKDFFENLPYQQGAFDKKEAAEWRINQHIKRYYTRIDSCLRNYEAGLESLNGEKLNFTKQFFVFTGRIPLLDTK